MAVRMTTTVSVLRACVIGLIVALISALAVTSAVNPTTAFARTLVPKICQSEIASSARYGVDVVRWRIGLFVIDGRTIQVSDDTQGWRVHDAFDNTFNTRFHGLEWLVPWTLAGGDPLPLLFAREAALPDPGGAASREELQATGWTTGAVRLRQSTVNCLFVLTGDERLRDVMEGLVAANLDPLRYRGRPLQLVHNNGMLANHVLIESARVFDRPEWADRAFQRMDADSDSVFTTCGMTGEQSSQYHLLNVDIWERGLQRAGVNEVPVAAPVSARIDRARIASVQLARPDGVLEAIGNSNLVDVSDLRRDVGQAALDASGTRLWCPAVGWAANRTSWDDTATHYTLRFGPSVRMHGHEDHGSITWFTRGVAVLSDPGLFDKTQGERRRSASAMSAHSVLEPLNRTINARTKGIRIQSDDGVDEYRLTTRRSDLTRSRQVEIDLQASSLRVQDEATSLRPTQWLQRWQLAPAWRPVTGIGAWTPIASHPRGLYLYAVCHSIQSMRMTVGTQEHYPQRRTAVPAMSLYCGGLDRTVRFDTLLVVSDVDGILSWDRTSGDYAITPR